MLTALTMIGGALMAVLSVASPADAVGLAWRRPRGWPALVVLLVAGLLVLFVHALSQEPQSEFSIPLTPMFALVAVAALFGKRTDSATVPES